MPSSATWRWRVFQSVGEYAWYITNCSNHRVGPLLWTTICWIYLDTQIQFAWDFTENTPDITPHFWRWEVEGWTPKISRKSWTILRQWQVPWKTRQLGWKGCRKWQFSLIFWIRQFGSDLWEPLSILIADKTQKPRCTACYHFLLLATSCWLFQPANNDKKTKWAKHTPGSHGFPHVCCCNVSWDLRILGGVENWYCQNQLRPAMPLPKSTSPLKRLILCKQSLQHLQ